MLNEMRFGKLSQKSIAAFKALSRPITYNDGIEPTVLFPMRQDVDLANSAKLQALNGDGWNYPATDAGAVTDPVQRAKLLANFMAPPLLQLRIDAQVMLIKNVDETLVNGSMGRVIGFEYKTLYETDGSGRWLDDVESILERTEDGQKELEFRASERKKYLNVPEGKPNPIVRFNTPLGKRDMLVEPDSFKTELPNGEVQASRLQVSSERLSNRIHSADDLQLPLILAWAMSIHKSQGQSEPIHPVQKCDKLIAST